LPVLNQALAYLCWASLLRALGHFASWRHELDVIGRSAAPDNDKEGNTAVRKDEVTRLLIVGERNISRKLHSENISLNWSKGTKSVAKALILRKVQLSTHRYICTAFLLSFNA
jgi:hypothetical protein